MRIRNCAWIRDGKNSDLGSGRNIPDSQHWMRFSIWVQESQIYAVPNEPRSESFYHILSVFAEVTQVNTACGCVACPGPPPSRILRIFWSAAELQAAPTGSLSSRTRGW
jgi:hypothetical protein